MGSFATVDDYRARYTDDVDDARLEVLLSDASVLIMSYPGFALLEEGDTGYEVQQQNLKRVCCAMVHRAQSAGDWAGLSSVSQGAGDYSASVSVANPNEYLYLTPQERKTLGMTGVRVRSIQAASCESYGIPTW